MESSKARYKVISLGTGSKCLGEKELSLNGSLVHDSHAEVIAKRAYVIYLLHHLEISYNAMVNNTSNNDRIFDYLENAKHFRLKDGIKFHFYSSHPPCGDATIASKPIISDVSDIINEELHPL